MQRSQPEDPDRLPFLILGHKLDLETEGPRAVTSEMGSQYCRNNGNMIFYETSAKNSVNVDIGFNQLAKEAIKI